MTSKRTKVGHVLAKGLGIDLSYRNETGNPAVDDKLTRGESVFSIESSDSYIEEEPRVSDWLKSYIPTLHDVLYYLRSLFPFTQWILNYNVQWLIGDLVAGTSGDLFPPTSGSVLTHIQRYHRWRCGCASGHGIRAIGSAPGGVRSLLIFHGRAHLLVLRHFKRHHNRCKFKMENLQG